MIRLEVEEYCENCPEFTPEVEKPTVLYANCEVYEVYGDTIIRCECRNRCRRIFDHIKKEKNK